MCLGFHLTSNSISAWRYTVIHTHCMYYDIFKKKRFAVLKSNQTDVLRLVKRTEELSRPLSQKEAQYQGLGLKQALLLITDRHFITALGNSSAAQKCGLIFSFFL